MIPMHAPAGPVTAAPPVRPSGWWYALTLGVAGVALVMAVGLLAGGIRQAKSTPQEATRVVPGKVSTVTFDKPESFTLYYVGPVRVAGSAGAVELASEIDPRLRPVGSGSVVAMSPYRTSDYLQRDRNGLQQVALSTFRIDEPGDYIFTSNPIDGLSEFDAQLILSPSPFRPLARRAVLALVLLGTGSVLSAVGTIALAVGRGRSKRAAHAFVMQTQPVWGWPARANPAGDPGRWLGTAPIVPPPPPGYDGPEARH